MLFAPIVQVGPAGVGAFSQPPSAIHSGLLYRPNRSVQRYIADQNQRRSVTEPQTILYLAEIRPQADNDSDGEV